MKLKITTIGNSAGVILPKELLARLHAQKGDALYAIELPDGIKLTPYDPELAAQMEVAEEVMRRRRTLLPRLPHGHPAGRGQRSSGRSRRAFCVCRSPLAP